ncbi:DUF2207 domain-containing protein [Collinsella sp. AGMB00827]|uniref:DUF2207 domain-containing protein n=1 Tax=Collinsella ureilytica TaxID=2869515 RepID=A0ABS7MJI6_9ACTN|nr:DUF2207 domain-containing protein [Collinsella urealyticum]MBY4797532.1 DUF2207 domain-containing protein [Collinsella urealyticum]
MRTRVFVLIATLALVLGLPVPAFARNFEMPQVDIAAVVQPDGSLHVRERRVFRFSDDVNGVFWKIPLGQNEQHENVSVAITSVRDLAGANDASGAASAGTSSGAAGTSSTSDAPGAGTSSTSAADNTAGTAYQRVTEAYPGDHGVYTVQEDGELTLKVFSPHESDTSAAFEVSYTLTGAVMAWKDTAELYWKFIGSDWQQDAEDVRLSITFAGAASSGVFAHTGDDQANFRAWGHGPLDGTVMPEPDSAEGPRVLFTAPKVLSGTFAEARVLFPTAWVPILSGQAEDRTDQVLKDEARWAQQANEKREQARILSYMLTGGAIAASVIFCIIALVARRAVKQQKPIFQETYFRDVPSDDHPAVISALMAENSVTDRALVATLMKLNEDRVISITKTKKVTHGFLGKERIDEDYLLSVDSNKYQSLQNRIDRAGLIVYTRGLDEYEHGLSFSEIREAQEEDSRGASERWSSFVDAVEVELTITNYVKSTGMAGRILGIIASVFCGMLIVGACAILESPWPLLGIPFVLVGMIVCSHFKRYSAEGAELVAKCEALKRWFEDFTRLGEAVPGDVVLWNKLLVLAVALGVSERVLEELAAATPAEFADSYGDVYPTWWLLTSHGSLSSPLSEAGDMGRSLSMSALAGSLDSSGGGFGGGFSGGGGGGAGGGGGGTF